MINQDLKYLLTHQNYALIGMNDDEEKIAYKIFFQLLEEHKTVTGIHPSLESVKEHTLVSSLEDITHPIDAVIFMVNPKIGINYLETIAKMNIQTIWLQPGTESEELIKRAKDLGLEVIENCVLTLLHQRIKAIVSDLDETLLRDDKEVSQKNFDIIQEIRNLGIHFIPATGRPYYSMKKTIQDLDLYKEDDYTISYNGGMIHNNKKDEPIKFHGLAFETVNELFELGNKEKVTMHVYLEDSTYAFNLNADEKEHIQYFPNIIESDEDNLDFLKDQRILKILYQDLDIPYLESLEAKVSEDLKEILEISYSSNRYLEFNPKGVSKGLAIKELCEILKIKPCEILSIGDNSNDLSMLKVTGYSAAPSNGVDAVKEEVDYTSIYNYNESAVADIIKHFMNQ